jgi:polyhydroxyalkanoate synthesis regulator phasin
MASSTSAKINEDVANVRHKPSKSTGERHSPTPSSATVAPPVAPSDIHVASTREIMSTLVNDIERLANGKEDAPSLRAKIKSSIQPMLDGIMQIHEHDVRSLQAKITELERKQQEAAARSLVVTSFENSLDRVTEGQVKSVRG